jgi:hypothetical protein
LQLKVSPNTITLSFAISVDITAAPSSNSINVIFPAPVNAHSGDISSSGVLVVKTSGGTDTGYAGRVKTNESFSSKIGVRAFLTTAIGDNIYLSGQITYKTA